MPDIYFMAVLFKFAHHEYLQQKPLTKKIYIYIYIFYKSQPTSYGPNAVKFQYER